MSYTYEQQIQQILLMQAFNLAARSVVGNEAA